MPSVLNFLPNAVGQGQAQIVYAEVAAPAPTSFTQTLYITLPDWTNEFVFPITNWPALNGSVLPKVGNAVLIVKDNRGNSRVVWWGAPAALWGGVTLPSAAPGAANLTLLSDGTGGSSWGNLIPTPTWTALTPFLGTNWADWDAHNSSTQYSTSAVYVDSGGWVSFHGLLNNLGGYTNGTSTATLFILPAAYVPARRKLLSVYGSDASANQFIARLDIGDVNNSGSLAAGTGQLLANVGSNTGATGGFVSLDNLRYNING